VPEPFHAVGLHYEDFRQTTDEEVRALLARGPEIGGQEQKGGA
jgi:predicted phosphoribosyltransferase